MTLLAFGATTDSGTVLTAVLTDAGELVVTIELELGEETHTLPAAAVAPEVRAIAEAQERAA